MKILSSASLSFALVVAMTATSCLSRFSDSMKSPCSDAGSTVKYEKPIGAAVSNLNVNKGLDVTYIQQPGEAKILVEGPENLIEYVTSDVKGQTLSISLSKSLNNCSSSLKITVTAPAITGFEASSGAALNISGQLRAPGATVSAVASSGASFSAGEVNAEKVVLRSSSGASASITGIFAGSVEAGSSSGASLSAAGKCNVAKLSASGGASLSGGGLKAESGTASATFGASLTCNISNPQSISSSGGGSISNK